MVAEEQPNPRNQSAWQEAPDLEGETVLERLRSPHEARKKRLNGKQSQPESECKVSWSAALPHCRHEGKDKKKTRDENRADEWYIQENSSKSA